MKTKRKVLVLALLLLLAATTIRPAFAVNTSSDSRTATIITVPTEDDLLACYQLAEATVKQYYNAEQKREETTFENIFLYESLNTYVQKRLEKSRALLYLESEELRNGVIGNYFTASCSLNEFEFRSDGLFIKVFVDAEVRYANRPQNYYFSNDVDALIVKENGQLRISDILFYETVMPELPALSTNRWDSRVNPTAVSEKLNQMESEIASSKYMFENIDEYLAEWQSDAELEIAERNVLKEKDPNTTTRATYSFNRSNMVSYARTTAPLKKHTDNRLYKDSNHTVSARGSSQAPYYYDFSSLSNAYDCTNFASHVLLSGGAKIKNNGVSAPNTTNGGGWYFNNANPPGPTSRSESWAGADAFGFPA